MAETTGKKRIIAVIAIAVLFIGGGAFLYQSNKSEDTKAKTTVKVTRSEIDYTPGLSDSKEYNEKENQYNQEVLKESLANGESNVPAITNNSAVKKAEQDAFDAFKEIDKVEEKKVEPKEPPKVEPQIVYVDRPVEKIVERKIMVPVQAPAQTRKVDESKQQEEFDQKSLEAMKKAFASLKSSYNTTTIQSYEAPRVAKVQESTDKSKQNVVSSDEKQKNILVRAGTILSGEIITAIDTDTLGVVVAEITTGKLKGARLLGSVTNAPTSVTDVVLKVSVKFDKISKPGWDQTYSIDAYLLDDETLLPATNDDVNNHYFWRYGLRAVASFVEGFGDAYSKIGTSTSTTNSILGNQTTQTQDANTFNGNIAAKRALGEAGKTFGQEIAQISRRPATIYVNSGKSIAIVFKQDF